MRPRGMPVTAAAGRSPPGDNYMDELIYIYRARTNDNDDTSLESARSRRSCYPLVPAACAWFWAVSVSRFFQRNAPLLVEHPCQVKEGRSSRKTAVAHHFAHLTARTLFFLLFGLLLRE
jgi:hypothetical protein